MPEVPVTHSVYVIIWETNYIVYHRKVKHVYNALSDYYYEIKFKTSTCGNKYSIVTVINWIKIMNIYCHTTMCILTR